MTQIYLAGCNRARRLESLHLGQGVLESYADRSMRYSPRRYPRLRWVLDCGAYTAYTRGTPIDLAEYCDYIVSSRGYEWYLSLDVIDGGELANASNFDHMRKRGLRPSPVWHEGESLYLLRDYCAEVHRMTT